MLSGGALNPATHRIWRHLLGRGDWTHVIDVGANYGEMLINAPLPARAQILAFEPNPLVVPYLAANLAEAGIRADVIATAVSDHVGSLQFFANRRWSGMSTICDIGRVQDKQDYEVFNVSSTTLAATLGTLSEASDIRALVKIDVEGHEIPVLQGLFEIIDELGDFAALIEVLHVPPAQVDWIVSRFNIELYELATDTLVPYTEATFGPLLQALAEGRFHFQDIVVLRKTHS